MIKFPMTWRALTGWLRCHIDHGGHSWTMSRSSTAMLRWRRCDRCTFTIVDGPVGRLRTFDAAGAFDPNRHVPPLPGATSDGGNVRG